MEEYLNKSIKEVINQFPEVGNILNEYNIGCAPCSVGSCLLKDIVEIHNLPSEEEQELMVRIARVIYPDLEAKIPEIKRKREARPKEISSGIRATNLFIKTCSLTNFFMGGE